MIVLITTLAFMVAHQALYGEFKFQKTFSDLTVTGACLRETQSSLLVGSPGGILGVV